MLIGPDAASGAAPAAGRNATPGAIPTTDPDAQLRALAARQHGIVARGQLLRAGVSRSRVDYLVTMGWLDPVHRGVYRVGPVPARYQREMAALLVCGEGVYLSHRSAAALRELL